MTIRVFVSYRRSDSRHATGRLRAVLAREFGRENVFYDVDSVGFGADFRDVINATLQNVDALIVVVGPGFEVDRLHQTNDYVRMEILEALRLNKGIIPVLVDEATMPSPGQLPVELESFAYRNAAPLRADPDFDNDAARLVRELRRGLRPQTSDVDPSPSLPPPAGVRISDPTEPGPTGSTIVDALVGSAGAVGQGSSAAPPIIIQATGLPAPPPRRQRAAVVAIVLALLALGGAVGAVLLRGQEPVSESGDSTVPVASSTLTSLATVPTTTTAPTAAPTSAPATVPPTPAPSAAPREPEPPVSRPSSVTRDEAADFIIDYFLAAGAREYPQAWDALSVRYQEEYGGYDSFVSFWSGVEIVGPSSLNATEVARSENSISISAPVFFDLYSGDHSEETITVTVKRNEDGQLLIDEYSSVRTN